MLALAPAVRPEPASASAPPRVRGLTAGLTTAFGLVLAMRSFGRSNPILSLVGLAVNGVALLLTAAIFFGLF